MAAAFELKKSGENYLFNLKAGNGEVILTSQRFPTKQAAADAINWVKTNSPADERYDREIAKDGSPFFRLKTPDDKIVGISEMYGSPSARDNGIASVKKNGPNAVLKDLTAD